MVDEPIPSTGAGELSGGDRGAGTSEVTNGREDGAAPALDTWSGEASSQGTEVMPEHGAGNGTTETF